jgi:hypothetical protein
MQLMNKFKYHKDGTTPKKDEVFVFGSNLAGIHGAGAAKAAKENFNAVLGKGVGLTGRSYAIPTKSRSISTLPLNKIEEFVNDFCRFTHAKHDLEFFVTRIGCGLAGYEDAQIAPMFKSANTNCNFPEEWAEYLEEE